MTLTATRSALALALLAAGCTKVTIVDNPDHCANNEGDRYCAERFPDRPYCNIGDDECSIGDRYGCVAEVAPECHAPCGALGGDECLGGTSSGTDTGTSTGTETSSETVTETEGETETSTTTGPMPCVNDEECTDPDAPFCGTSGECGTCEGTKDPDGACAEVDAGLPLCVGGACVACTPENPAVCDAQLLLCDGDTNACVPCTEHDQCGSGACELAVGMCFPPDMVVHVDGDPGAMPSDFATVAAAIASVGDGERRVIVVHELDGGVSYQGAVTIDAGRVIALFGAPGESPVIQGTAGNPGVTVQGAGTALYMDGLTVSLSAALGLRANGAMAWVDRSRIVQNTGGGVLAEAGAELVLRNSFVGGDYNDAIALEVDAATATVLYSTLGGGTFNANALACTAPLAVEVRNSTLVTRGGTPPDEVSCSAATITYSATEGIVIGEGNVAVGMFPGGSPGDWFTDYATGTFGLQNQGLIIFADVAEWRDGDPLIDIDGDPRPNLDGSPDYAGADLPQ